jgi:hypothetical protein
MDAPQRQKQGLHTAHFVPKNAEPRELFVSRGSVVVGLLLRHYHPASSSSNPAWLSVLAQARFVRTKLGVA